MAKLVGTAAEVPAHAIPAKPNNGIYWFIKSVFFMPGFYRVVFSVEDDHSIKPLEHRFEVIERSRSSSYSSSSVVANTCDGVGTGTGASGGSLLYPTILVPRPLSAVTMRGAVFSVTISGMLRAELLDDMRAQRDPATEQKEMQHTHTTSFFATDVFAAAMCHLNVQEKNKIRAKSEEVHLKRQDVDVKRNEDERERESDGDFTLVFDKLRASFEELFESCLLYKHEKAKWKKIVKSNKRFLNYASIASPLHVLRFVIFLVTRMTAPGAAHATLGSSREHRDNNADKDTDTNQRVLRKRERSAISEVMMSTDLAQKKMQRALERLVEEIKIC